MNWEMEVKAELEKWKEVREFVEKICAVEKINAEKAMELKIAVEELFANIINYSGTEKLKIKIATAPKSGEIKLQIIDSGIEFNPLTIGKPDFSIPYEEKEVGGLGIFLVRENVDEISYERRGDKNILTISKKI